MLLATLRLENISLIINHSRKSQMICVSPPKFLGRSLHPTQVRLSNYGVHSERSFARVNCDRFSSSSPRVSSAKKRGTEPYYKAFVGVGVPLHMTYS